MPNLAALPQVRTVDPAEYPAFSTFSCGGSTAYEQEVDEIVADLHSGAAYAITVRVAEDASSGDLLGLCGIQARPLPPDYMDAAYIGVIGLSSAYRGGYRLPNGETRIGEFLLGDALRLILPMWNPTMPHVWAYVDPQNVASHNIFADLGFGHIRRPGHPYDIRLRPAGLRPPPPP